MKVLALMLCMSLLSIDLIGGGRHAHIILRAGDTLAVELLAVRDSALVVTTGVDATEAEMIMDTSSILVIPARSIVKVVDPGKSRVGLGVGIGMLTGMVVGIAADVSAGRRDETPALNLFGPGRELHTRGLIIGSLGGALGGALIGAVVSRPEIDLTIHTGGDLAPLRRHTRFGGGDEPVFLRRRQ